MSSLSRYQAAVEALGGKGNFVHPDGKPMDSMEIDAWERSGDKHGPTIRNFHPRLDGSYSGSDGKSYELKAMTKKESRAANRKQRIFGK